LNTKVRVSGSMSNPCVGVVDRKGEEVSHTYNWGNERNDYSLINYFFIQKPQPPRMCALDLPNGSLEGGFGEHDDHYLPHEKGAIQVASLPSLICQSECKP
jgi:hypothetical protein